MFIFIFMTKGIHKQNSMLVIFSRKQSITNDSLSDHHYHMNGLSCTINLVLFGRSDMYICGESQVQCRVYFSNFFLSDKSLLVINCSSFH
jgi:hypothetical protein